LHGLSDFCMPYKLQVQRTQIEKVRWCVCFFAVK